METMQAHQPEPTADLSKKEALAREILAHMEDVERSRHDDERA